MADGPSPLDRLAAALGIAPTYENAAGETVTIANAVKRRLVAALGFDPDAAADHLSALAAAEAGRALPPVVVDRSDGRAVTVPVTRPAGRRRVSWRVDLEDGGTRQGVADLADPQPGGEAPGGRIVLGALPLGTHRLSLTDPAAAATLIVAPSACARPAVLSDGGRRCGLSVWLPLLRSSRNWGIGDFVDLRDLAVAAAAAGADVIGLNPLHALFQDDPAAASPYSPASRLLLDPMLIAVDAVPGWAAVRADLDDGDLGRRLQALRAADLVDHAGVAAVKLKALRALHARFRRDATADERAAFDGFVAAQSEGFRRACLFLALRTHFAGMAPPRPDWREWPADFRAPDGPGARGFAAENPEAVELQLYLQWIADGQLAAAARAAADAGMAIGLYRDLAVGADPAGAETFADAEAVIRGATVGAPPDLFMPTGQNWNLPPFNPRALRAAAYAPFAELIAANMRHAGGLRIDHVMGLMHLWCIPAGSPASAGAYLDYPFDDLLGVLALESRRRGCLVVGEDLGTVPEGFRDRMAAAGVLSYRVLFFEQDFDRGVFSPPDAYPEAALAVAGSHDLATLRGWFAGRDNAVKERLGLFPTAAVAADQRARRDRDRAALTDLLVERGHLAPGDAADADAFAAAAHAFLAETRATLVLVQLDDVTGESEQINVPGTVAENPNWRRKYRLPLEALVADGTLAAALAPVAARKARAASAPIAP